ncbi:hypothetical protein P3T76_012927 [Phytophthora citrophthora]|uniref:Uncharacterized protein n=1 Tax=Phytophthora citrophthora TaxID=4793 RepID=A0AAD9LCI1_9STRA|nr:hypothetical protein P3T76_012927 [Phytophthora citrophthora]
MKTKDTNSAATPLATAQDTHDKDMKNEEDEEEMPLLFMDELPSNFKQSAQLAAIATFMADSDDDAAVDDQEEASEAGNDSKQRRQRRNKSVGTRRRQQPYAKLPRSDTEHKRRENRNEPKSSDTKELQLFLSMFHVS